MLLVDSYDSSRRALADLLREAGYAVREARDGEEGLRSAGGQPPRLVILDPFPDLAGSERMLRELRQASGGRAVPCVVLTSASEAQLRDRALDSECAAVLEKPCAPAEVLAVVRRVLAPELAAQSAAPPARWSWRRG